MRTLLERMSVHVWSLPVILLLLGYGMSSCTDDAISDPGKIVFPDSNVSFAAQVRPFLTLSCNMTGCHDAARPDNYNMDLTSWIGVRSNEAAVPYDTNCHLVLVMYAREIHPAVFTATDNQRQGIKQWVLEGAKDN